MESSTEAEAFEFFLDRLIEIRKEKPEQFINAVFKYAESANEKDKKYLLYRIKLSDEEILLMYKILFATATLKEIPSIVSFVQDHLLDLAGKGKRVTAEFLKLEDSIRFDALKKIKFSNEEIVWLCATFQNYNQIDLEELKANSLYPSIKWKLSLWVAIGLFPYQQDNPLKNSSDFLISQIKNNTDKPDEIRQVFENVFKTIRGENILKHSDLKNLILDKKKAGRSAACLDKKTGKITGKIKPEIKQHIENWNDGKSVDDIFTLYYSQKMTPTKKTEIISKIRRNLRNNRRLLSRPYDGK
jgi:hypothetical protein